MKTVILCGGYGSRIRDVSDVVPKPMLSIGGRPILWHIMKMYAAHGLNDFVLCLGYKGWLIREFFLNFRAMVTDCTFSLGRPDEITFHGDFPEQDWRVTLLDTGEHTMTGGRVWRAREHIDGDHFCLTYGDGLADVNLRELVRTHIRSGAIATVTAVHVAGRFGELEIDGDRVRTFNEKPAVTAGRISGGFFVMDNRRVWDYFDEREDLVLEQETLRRLAEAGELGVYRHDGYWQCMDTPREHQMLNGLWAERRAPWAVGA